ncbi:MAG TPA: LLM class flavin-dependent oxidoreductase, partial [Dehalococcoidia bacterium]|nr:LLM class flavin-dependent oxidoreductase [Dehalococcoidia bacterium]
MKFGIFMAPFHRVGDNPTLALQRDLELIQWLDYLGYDEAWIGEHHSAGWEIIASPELMIAAAAERTKQIMLGTGVTSLPYHHPLIVADRMVQLDHMTRGRAMLGVGPGALTSDAYMMGIDPATQRPRMEEALDAIVALLAGETVNMKTDWFELREARLQLLPYTRPCFPIAVASVLSPAGMLAAGKHGLGVLSIGASVTGEVDGIRKHWALAEEAAAKNGKAMDRAEWRLVKSVHLAETREQAYRDVEAGERRETVGYFQQTLGQPPGSDNLEELVRMGVNIVGTPDDAIEALKKLQADSGGFGGLLIRATEWANREATMRSFELLARYVMPHF